jgi:alanine dehydrogenase
VVIVGGGVVGTNAAEIALGMGANVTIIDLSLDRLRYLDSVLHGRLHTLASNEDNIAQAVRDADLVIGAVLLPGARAPMLVTEPMVAAMKPASVIVDVAIDQGGCIETAHPTTHSEPTYVKHGVVHYCVTNMPGAVPQTSSQAICAAILPWVNKLASGNAWRDNDALQRGINVEGGRLVHPALLDRKV